MDYTNLIIFGIIAFSIYSIFFKEPNINNIIGSELGLTPEQREQKQLEEIRGKYSQGGWVYLIERDGYYKIGKTKINSYIDEKGTDQSFIGRFKSYTEITGLPINKYLTNLIFFTATSNFSKLETYLFNCNELKDYHFKLNTGEEWFSKFPYRHKLKVTQNSDASNFIVDYEKNLENTMFPITKCIEIMKDELGVDLKMDLLSKQFLNHFAYKQLINKPDITSPDIFLHPFILNDLNLTSKTS